MEQSLNTHKHNIYAIEKQCGVVVSVLHCDQIEPLWMTLHAIHPLLAFPKLQGCLDMGRAKTQPYIT